MKEKDEKKLNIACENVNKDKVTRMDKINNEYIRGSLKVAPITVKFKGNRLSWYGHGDKERRKAYEYKSGVHECGRMEE
jgi:hypothetical protein